MQSVPVLEERDRYRDAQPSVCYMPLMKPGPTCHRSSFVAAAASFGWIEEEGFSGLVG